MTSESDLCDLFNRYGSNKDHNGYVQAYEALLHSLQKHPVTILIIGLDSAIKGTGSETCSSLLAWRDYFSQGRIIGIDTQSDTQLTDESRIETYLLDTTILSSVNDLMKKLEGIQFDVIIDSDTHKEFDQIKTLRNLYSHLKPNGFYFIENIILGSKLVECPGLIGCACNHDSYFFTGIQNKMCVIHKHHLESKRLGY
jgi:hypothetical protein